MTINAILMIIIFKSNLNQEPSKFSCCPLNLGQWKPLEIYLKLLSTTGTYYEFLFICQTQGGDPRSTEV